MANKEIRDIVFNLQVNTSDGKVKIEGLTKGFVKAETAVKKMQGALGEVNTQFKQAGSASGLASTAVLEFGRTMSDAPYGIQGVANNIQQLVTIMGQLSEKTKGGGSAMGELIKQLKGPLGIVVGVQVAIAAIQMFANKVDESSKNALKLAEATATSGTALKLAKLSLDDENVSLEKKQSIVDTLNEKYPEWNLTLEESGNLSEENEEKIDGEISALGRLAKAKAYQSILEEAYAKKAKMLTNAQIDQADWWTLLTSGLKNYGSAVGGVTAVGDALGKTLQETDESIAAIENAIKDEGLVETIIGTDEKGDIKPEKKKKVKKLVVDTYNISLIEAKKAAQKQEKMMKKLGIDIPSLLMGGEEGKEAFKEGLASLYKETEDVPIDYSGVGTSFNEILETMSPAFAEIGNFFSAEADRAIAIEENKTNRINDQLKKRLANEQLSAEERDKINQQIARNEAKLVEKENAINKKRFEQEKAFSIVQATVNTYLAASDVLAREKMGAVGKAIAVAAVITSGLAQVASISRQQFTAKAIPSPNLSAQGGAGGTGINAPSFNVVGSSAQNQLAAAIAGTQSQPVKAYVVSSDVSTAQEFDRKIVEGASI